MEGRGSIDTSWVGMGGSKGVCVECKSNEDTKAFAKQILDLLVDQHNISGDRIQLKKDTNKSREYEIVHRDIQV